jgi:hypothetical protein
LLSACGTDKTVAQVQNSHRHNDRNQENGVVEARFLNPLTVVLVPLWLSMYKPVTGKNCAFTMLEKVKSLI